MREQQAELRSVAMFTQRFEADLAVSQLAAAGIDAIISGPDAGGSFPAVLGGIRVLVHQADLADAEAILRRQPEPTGARTPDRTPLSSWIGLTIVVAVLAWIFFRTIQHHTQ